MTLPSKHSFDSDTVRARVDPAIKEQWEEWCVKVNITPSQGLRWLLIMHLQDPSKIWEFLSKQDKFEEGRQ